MQTVHAGMLKYLKINGVGNLETKRMFYLFKLLLFDHRFLHAETLRRGKEEVLKNLFKQ